jgi:hypothetical protein
VAPGSWPAGRVVAWLSNWIWVIPYAMLTLLFLLFPTGRLRSRVQRAVDRRFNRARYDADQMVMAFAARLTNAVDLDSVRDDLAGVVHQALEPAHISVWISQRD